MMQSFELGQHYPEFATQQDTARIAMSESGLFLPVSLSAVLPEDVAAFSATAPFEIRFTVLRSVIFFVFRLGTLDWMDAPYYPFSRMEVPPIDPTLGLALHCALFQSQDGRLRAQRLIGCGHRFSVALVDALVAAGQAELAITEYERRVSEVYAAYATRDILTITTDRYKLR